MKSQSCSSVGANMHTTWLARRSMLPRDKYISHDGLGQEATLYTSLRPTSQQTTNYHRPSAQLFPSQLHRSPGEFTVLFLQHLYATESSVMLRSTKTFAQEAQCRVDEKRHRSTVRTSNLQIGNKKDRVCSKPHEKPAGSLMENMDLTSGHSTALI